MEDYSVELVVQTTTPAGEHVDQKSKPKQQNLWRFFIVMLVGPIMAAPFDVVVTALMINLHLQASASTNCDYLCNPLLIATSLLGIMVTTWFVVSFINLYGSSCGKANKTKATIFYFIAMMVHSLFFWYENVLIGGMDAYTDGVGYAANCQIDGNLIGWMKMAMFAKSACFTLCFVMLFVYKLYMMLARNNQRCMTVFIVALGGILMLFLLAFVLYSYGFFGAHLHGIAALMGALHMKFCGAHHAQHLTSTYVYNEPEGVGACCKCCKAGWGFSPSHGCCECNCRSGGCCICFGWNIFRCTCCNNPDGVPASACCSFCGCYTMFCCDPGGCYDGCYASVDYCTWC